MRNDDLNSQNENSSYKEYDDHDINSIPSVNEDVKEYSTVTENGNEEAQYNVREVKKKKATAALSGSLVGIIGIAALSITSLLNVKMNATFDNVVFEDSNISYEVSVSDMTEKESLNAYLYLDSILVETIPLVDQDNDGKISGTIEVNQKEIDEKLKADDNVSIRYNLKLKGNVGLNVEREFDSYVIKIDKMTSVFESIDGECHCGVDGTYHFKMNYKDDYDLFSNFEAYIEDSYGNKAVCKFTDNLHDEQTINVTQLKGSNVKLVISYDKKDEPRVVITKDIKL